MSAPPAPPREPAPTNPRQKPVEPAAAGPTQTVPNTAAPTPAAATPPASNRTATAPSPTPAAIVAAPSAPLRAATSAARGNRDFLTLPASSYVIELAHGASRSDLAALRESLHVPRGELYELHLARDGGEWWVLVWGSFDSMSAARSARAELPADAAVSVGWPRQVAPLQNEARRRTE
ncbi:MAG TPA: hypothetical protein VF132_09775 [Rudaea sp.]